jgi:hypothetical protein
MNDDDYGALLLRPLITEPPATTRVDVAEAMRTGRRHRRARSWFTFSGLTALTAATATGGVLALTGTDPTPKPDLPPDPVPPAACTAVRLPTGGAASAAVTGGDPTGAYLVGTTNPDAGKERAVLVWRDGRLTASVPLSGKLPVMSDINSSGVAVGSSPEMTYLPYVYRDGKVSRLKGIGMASVINNAGTIAGTRYDGKTAIPVRWAGPDAEPELMRLPAGTDSGKAVDITEDGTIAVTLSSGGPLVEHTYLWLPDGTVRQIEPPPTGKGAANRFSASHYRFGWLYGGVVEPAQHGTAPAVPEMGGFEVHAYRYHVDTETWQKMPDGLGPLSAFIGRKIFTYPEPAAKSPEDAFLLGYVSEDARTAGGHSFSNRANPDHPAAALMWRCS